MVGNPTAGLVDNSTSTVLYGTVPDLASVAGTERAFALFHPGTIASGAISPVIDGFPSDWIGIHGATFATTPTPLPVFPREIAPRAYLAPEEKTRA